MSVVPTPPETPRRTPGTRGVIIAAAVVAIASALLGILFPPLWVVTAASLVYLLLSVFAARERTQERKG